jgi:tRNA(His) 5'-end guanylyltransferase
MIFKSLEDKMRHFEHSNQHSIPFCNHIIVRLDGRSFTKMTKERFNKPFDPEFADYMVKTTHHLVKESGFNIVYAYTQSDEISVLLHVNDNTFSRKESKIITVLSGITSSCFGLYANDVVSFDARLVVLPNIDLVSDYFVWRMKDSERNSLNTYAYWNLINSGLTAKIATNTLKGLSVQQKHDLLMSNGVNYNSIKSWIKRGHGLHWKTIKVQGVNPLENKNVIVDRRCIYTDSELPMSSEYYPYVSSIVRESEK